MTNINVGSGFYIGRSHKVCQDFAHHDINPIPYILVSDGCSASAKTDFGSRILSQVTSGLMSYGETFDIDFDIDKVMIESDQIRRLLNLPQESLDATFLFSYIQNKKYHLYMFGDGVAVKSRNDGTLQVIMIEYPSGAPNYPNYGLNQTRRKKYIEMFGLKRIVSRYTIKLDGSIQDSIVKEDCDGSFYYEEGSYDELKAISLMSDGVLSFSEMINTGTSKSDKCVQLNDVIRRLLDFKGFQGEFVNRRLQRFHKDCEKSNWIHTDDLALSTLSFTDENQTSVKDV